MGNIFGDRLTTCLCSDWSGQVKFQQPKISIKHNCERLIVHIHNYSVKPVTNKSNLSVCLRVCFSLCSAEIAKETYLHVKLWDHSSAIQPVPGIQMEGGGSKNKMQFFCCFNFIFFFTSTSALAEQVKGHLAPKSFRPSYWAPYSRTRNYLKSTCFGSWLKERGVLHYILKHACFALWIIEWGISHLKRAKWLESRGPNDQLPLNTWDGLSAATMTGVLVN